MRGKVKTKDGMESKGGAGEKRRNGMKKGEKIGGKKGCQVYKN